LTSDRVDQLGNAVHSQALELALAEVAEEALDEIEPR
jgi:hypothetical protein